MQNVILKCENINKVYKKDGYEKQALCEVSFNLCEGEILGIVGESGSGKSTLLRMVSGIETPDSGSLYFKEKAYIGASLKKNGSFLQIIFQDAYGSFDPHFSMKKSLMEGGRYSFDEVREVLKKVNLSEELLDRKPKALSGGQCQRMAISRALLSKPKVLLCDEITSALDVTTQAKVVELIARLNQTERLSILFVSHDIALVSNICNRMIVMKDGKIVEAGETPEIISHPKHEYTKSLIAASAGVA
jgi:peptide/nickel transport system ATP-binding protein